MTLICIINCLYSSSSYSSSSSSYYYYYYYYYHHQYYYERFESGSIFTRDMLTLGQDDEQTMSGQASAATGQVLWSIRVVTRALLTE